MMSFPSRRTVILPFLLSGSLCSCANHLDPETQALHRVDRKTIHATIDISGPASQPLASPYLEVAVVEHRQTHVTEYGGSARFDVYTPYQGWRKVYEIPEGLLLLPVAIVASIVSSSQTPELLDRSISGINPFLNIEDKSRSERKLLDKAVDPYDEHDEYSTIPLSGATLSIRAYGQSHGVALDENGKARIGLLGYYRADTATNTIELSITADGVSKTGEWLLAPGLDKKLAQAKAIADRLQSVLVPTDLKMSRAQLKGFVHGINALSGLGFGYDAEHLQEQFSSQLDEQEKTEFAGLQATLDE